MKETEGTQEAQDTVEVGKNLQARITLAVGIVCVTIAIIMSFWTIYGG